VTILNQSDTDRTIKDGSAE